MDAGKLTKKVTIQRQTLTKNALGEAVKSFADHLTRFANIKFLSTREYIIGKSQVNSEIEAEIWLRQPVDIVATDQIKWGNRIFSIVGNPIPVDSYWYKILVKETNA